MGKGSMGYEQSSRSEAKEVVTALVIVGVTGGEDSYTKTPMGGVPVPFCAALVCSMS